MVGRGTNRRWKGLKDLKVKWAVQVLTHHPAYLFFWATSVYERYESARLRRLHLRGVEPVLCMGTFYMYPDPTDSHPGASSSILLRGGFYEPESTDLFRRSLAEGAVVLDIGANIGWYTLLAGKAVGPSGKVVACEPEPHSVRLLERSVKLNRLTNVVLVEKCVSDKNGDAILHLSATNAGGHSILQSADSVSDVRVDSITIDELCHQLSLERVDVIKMDAEGAEPLIFVGASSLLSRAQPRHVLMEYSPSAWEGFAPILTRLFDEFTVFEVRRRAAPIRRLSSSELPSRRQAMLFLVRKGVGGRNGQAALRERW